MILASLFVLLYLNKFWDTETYVCSLLLIILIPEFAPELFLFVTKNFLLKFIYIYS